jgi:hypothetical protein
MYEFVFEDVCLSQVSNIKCIKFESRENRAVYQYKLYSGFDWVHADHKRGTLRCSQRKTYLIITCYFKLSKTGLQVYYFAK